MNSLPINAPDATCDFGACGLPGNTFVGGAAAAAAPVIGTIICEIAEPCGVIEDIIIGGTIVVGVAGAIINASKTHNERIAPSWAEGERPRPGESAKDFAKRLCDARYGPGNYDTGPNSEYGKIKKWARDKFGI